MASKRSTISVPVQVLGGCIPARVRVADLTAKDFASIVQRAYQDAAIGAVFFGEWDESEGSIHKTRINADSVIRFAIMPSTFSNVRDITEAKGYLIKGLAAFGFVMTFDGLMFEGCKATFHVLRFERLKEVTDV